MARPRCRRGKGRRERGARGPSRAVPQTARGPRQTPAAEAPRRPHRSARAKTEGSPGRAQRSSAWTLRHGPPPPQCSAGVGWGRRRSRGERAKPPQTPQLPRRRRQRPPPPPGQHQQILSQHPRRWAAPGPGGRHQPCAYQRSGAVQLVRFPPPA
eukprot:6885606-Alexandrium_andersonii.AAC.1